MSAFGGKADIEAKPLNKDEARRIAVKYRQAAGACCARLDVPSAL
jgi:hypothetical protein